MQRTLRPASILFTATVMFANLVLPVHATQYQQCQNGTDCQIGEFLYDDNYQPISGASCNLNVKDPNSLTIINNVAMTGSSDGWYSHTLTAPSRLGVYRAQLCCNASGEYLCIDKSFEVIENNEAVASAVWANSGRSNFIAEMWNYSSDSLGSFASKVTSIFQRTGKIENTTDSIQTDTDSLQVQVGNTAANTQNILSGLLSENRELLEQLINAPMIQNFIEEEDVIPLSEKVAAAAGAVNQAYSTTQTVKAKLTSLLSKWPTLTSTKIDAEFESMLSLLGTTADTNTDDSLMGSLNLLLSGWESPIIGDTSESASNAITSLTTTQQSLATEGTETTIFQDNLIESLEVVSSLEENVGDASDSLANTTLFGFLRKLQASADSFGTAETDIDQLIKNYAQFSDREMNDQIAKLQTQILGSNQIRGAENLLKDPINPDNPDPRFILYGLKGIISLNRAGVSTSVKNPLSDMWLQDQPGFMMVRGYIYNPSDENVTREIKYALPIEILAEHVLSHSDTLTVAYDAAQALMVANGSINLSPKELTTFYIQLKDVWAITDTDLESMRTQAQDLVNSLRRTAGYPQATSIKSDIEVTLDKIKVKLAGNYTPENRIRAVRDAQLDLFSVQEKINTLKNMVTESASAKSIVGAVGGVQAVAVWGLILIFVSGFVFLVVFMRRMQPVAAGVGIRRSVVAHPINLSDGHNPSRIRVPRMPVRSTDFAATLPKFDTPYGKLALTIVMTIGLATVVVSLISRTSKPTAAVEKTAQNPKLQSQGMQLATPKEEVAAAPSETPVKETSQNLGDPTLKDTTVLGTSSTEMMLTVEKTPVAVLAKPDSTAKMVMSLTESQFVYIFDVKKDTVSGNSYSRIGFSADDDAKDWWVETALLSTPN